MKQNFRTLAKLLVITVVATVACSCSKEKDYLDVNKALDPGVERHINGSANLPTNNDKAFLDGFKVKWEEGDRININGVTLTASNISNDLQKPQATFDGTVYAKDGGGEDLYWAVYPSTLAGDYTTGIPSEFGIKTFTYNFPAEQNFNATPRPLTGINYMAGRVSVEIGESNIQIVMKAHYMN